MEGKFPMLAYGLDWDKTEIAYDGCFCASLNALVGLVL